uniref:Uncharacterized protein n=1 Tax=Angiostrongylus cantonensis TaxID=6313 RepID=A0A0K0DKR4_ANGCA
MARLEDSRRTNAMKQEMIAIMRKELARCEESDKEQNEKREHLDHQHEMIVENVAASLSNAKSFYAELKALKTECANHMENKDGKALVSQLQNLQAEFSALLEEKEKGNFTQSGEGAAESTPGKQNLDGRQEEHLKRKSLMEKAGNKRGAQLQRRFFFDDKRSNRERDIAVDMHGGVPKHDDGGELFDRPGNIAHNKSTLSKATIANTELMADAAEKQYIFSSCKPLFSDILGVNGGKKRVRFKLSELSNSTSDTVKKQ